MRYFKYTPGSRSEDYMKMLILPALEVLTVEDQTYIPGYIIDTLALHPFLSACANSLRRITLIEAERNYRPPPDCGVLVNILSALPSLEYLELGLIYMPHSYFDPFLARLAETGNAGGVTFLPELQSLKFNSLSGVSWPLIPSIFWWTGSPNPRPLRQLIIEDVMAVKAESLTIDVIDQLIDLLDDGVDIQLYDEEGERIFVKDSAR
ncbi:hypothetical protein D9619_008391 [Psilocybe cf. subviscida]|uniref:Uncharacterized protein n=1 Tax=Psilocybe cf. subviscida TaxID=2480587 RepID=A0A8H5BAB8_9AGAR|nr:hypothetical protein D9619_008391 [Psilocybe cf. subviscida]